MDNREEHSTQWGASAKALRHVHISTHLTFLHLCSVGKESACSEGDSEDAVLIPGSGRFPGGGNGNPLQSSCQENPTDRGAQQAIGSKQSIGWQTVGHD